LKWGFCFYPLPFIKTEWKNSRKLIRIDCLLFNSKKYNYRSTIISIKRPKVDLYMKRNASRRPNNAMKRTNIAMKSANIDDKVSTMT